MIRNILPFIIGLTIGFVCQNLLGLIEVPILMICTPLVGTLIVLAILKFFGLTTEETL